MPFPDMSKTIAAVCDGDHQAWGRSFFGVEKSLAAITTVENCMIWHFNYLAYQIHALTDERNEVSELFDSIGSKVG